MAHLVKLWSDDGDYVAVPTVTFDVGPKFQTHPDDISLVNHLLRLIYSHQPAASWPTKSLPPKNGHFTKVTSAFVKDWNANAMNFEVAGDILGPVPPTNALNYSCSVYTMASLARAAVMLMSSDGDPDDPWITLVGELKKMPLLAHLDRRIISP